jgi:hypothetical protein
MAEEVVMAGEQQGGEAGGEARSTRRGGTPPVSGAAQQAPLPPAYEDPFLPLGQAVATPAAGAAASPEPEAAPTADVASRLVDPFDVVVRAPSAADAAPVVDPLQPLHLSTVTVAPEVSTRLQPAVDDEPPTVAEPVAAARPVVADDVQPEQRQPEAEPPPVDPPQALQPEPTPPRPEPEPAPEAELDLPEPSPPPAPTERPPPRVLDDPLGLGDVGLIAPVLPTGPTSPTDDVLAGTLRPVDVSTDLADLDLLDLAPVGRETIDTVDVFEPLVDLDPEIGLEADPLAPLLDVDSFLDLGLDSQFDVGGRFDDF